MNHSMDSIKNKKAFTLVEVLIISLIIGLLASIILAIGVSRGRDRAAINSYKTSMSSVQAAMELCGNGNRSSGPNIGENSNICSSGYDTVKYPDITDKCGDMSYGAIIYGNDSWEVTTMDDCLGCKIICNPEGCVPSPTSTNCES